jgi:predicted enzyme related to lactoylglutathione lyase
MSIKYVHTNIISKDWKALSNFYIKVFNCRPIEPIRNLNGTWLEALTNLPNCNIEGVHLQLPGYIDGPTLEIFSYQPENTNDSMHQLNSFGLAHLAFHVDDVKEVLERLITYKGTQHGKIVSHKYPEIGTLSIVYACDPDGNFIEIQHWDKYENQ